MENFQDQGQRLQCSATTSHLYPSCISLPFRHKMDAYAMFREGWNCEKIVNSMLRIEVSWCLQKSWFKMHLWDKYMLSFQRDLSDFKLHVSPTSFWHFQVYTFYPPLLLLEWKAQETQIFVFVVLCSSQAPGKASASGKLLVKICWANQCIAHLQCGSVYPSMIKSP